MHIISALPQNIVYILLSYWLYAGPNINNIKLILFHNDRDLRSNEYIVFITCTLSSIILLTAVLFSAPALVNI